VGTGVEDSRRAVDFAKENEGVYATVGVHPSELAIGELSADSHCSCDGDQILDSTHPVSPTSFVGVKSGQFDSRGVVLRSETEIFDTIASQVKELAKRERVVAIGEIGLDYHYEAPDRARQIELFERQLQVAQDLEMPVVFHVREAFEDFFAVMSGFSKVRRGVVHSFSDGVENLERAVEMGFYVGVNGLATFTKSAEQLEAYARLPLERMLLETDAPYLTPVPFRGKLNEPTYVGFVAEWVAKSRRESRSVIEVATTKNAADLFGI